MTAAWSCPAIAAMGTGLGPDVLSACRALFDDEQRALAAAVPPLSRDLAYGPDARHRLDLYGEPGGARPVLLFVHGGGFVQGDKGAVSGCSNENWTNAAVGRMAARLGFIGAVMNYRLAPDHGWPAGAEDVAAAIVFLRDRVGRYGGDAARIVAMGTSAGAVHVAGFLKLVPDHAAHVRGAILLSGLYGYTPPDPKDERYYGSPEFYLDRAPRDAVEGTTLPLFVACAEHDPVRFQREFVELLANRQAIQQRLPRSVILSGHNHYSMAMHLGTSDTRLADEIATFVKDVT